LHRRDPLLIIANDIFANSLQIIMRPDVYGDNNVANVKNEKSESGTAQSAARIFAIIPGEYRVLSSECASSFTLIIWNDIPVW